jgi:hypothetical protein
MNDGRWQAWFFDQYRHPHETRHSINEVLGWFDTAGVDFLSSIPAADGSPFTDDTRLFAASTGHQDRPVGNSVANAPERRSRWGAFHHDRAQGPIGNLPRHFL